MNFLGFVSFDVAAVVGSDDNDGTCDGDECKKHLRPYPAVRTK